jgi:hypothetical protein
MTRITRGTTRVFADLDFPDALELQTKTRLALSVNERLKARKLEQREIATALGVTQPGAAARNPMKSRALRPCIINTGQGFAVVTISISPIRPCRFNRFLFHL